MNQVAAVKEKDGKNLLHLAAALAASEQDTRYFVRLLDLNFPLYNMDSEQDFPPFLITKVKDSSSFSSVFNALVIAGFDINYPNEDSLTFLQKLVMEGQPEMNKMKVILQTEPTLYPSHIAELDAKVKLSWVTYNNPVVKAAISALKEYVANVRQ